VLKLEGYVVVVVVVVIISWESV